MNALDRRTIEMLSAQNKLLRLALEEMLSCGEMRAWDHETSTPKQREAMKLARSALAASHG